MNLGNLLTGVMVPDGSIANMEIKNVVTNSAEVEKGDLFVALCGVKFDGHKYIDMAVRSGAVAVIGEKDMEVSVPYIKVDSARTAVSLIYDNFFGNPSHKLKFLGVTGTNGKTSTACLAHHILTACGKKAGLIGTIENIVGEKRTPAAYTTPEPSQFYKLLAEMVDADCEYCIMEVSSHALSQNRTAGIDFVSGAFTNLTRDHIDYHLTMENYLLEKLKLMKISKHAVVNADDRYSERFCEAAKDAMTYGLSVDADLRAENIRHTDTGSDFTVLWRDEIAETSVPVKGLFSVYNALCAIGLAVSAGIPFNMAALALKTAPGVRGRMESYPTDLGFDIILDYAHTPDGLKNALSGLQKLPHSGKLTVLFGCGGDRDKQKRPMMGTIAAEMADSVIVTSDNPRTENPSAIIDNILEGMAGSKTPYIVIENRRQAIKHAIETAKEGDLLLFAGKGHEDYQILDTGKIHFDEREVIAQIIDELKKTDRYSQTT